MNVSQNPSSQQSSAPAQQADAARRPQFMQVLGLGPPYTEPDVREAYFEQAKRAHPDRGGSPVDFNRVRQAFEQALEYVRYRSGRRSWIAAQIERYQQSQQTQARLAELGAEVIAEGKDWQRESFGDFAVLNERIVGIKLNDSSRGDDLLKLLAEDDGSLVHLRSLDLAGTPFDEQVIYTLRVFEVLESLNLDRTNVSRGMLEFVRYLPALREVRLAGTGVGAMERLRISRLLARRKRRDQKRLSL